MPRSTMLILTVLTLPLLSVLMTGGCSAQSSRSPYSNGQSVNRDPEAARHLVAQARSRWKTDPTDAEHLLRQALEADLYCGSAHNNLGVLLLEQGRLYEAAGEFEWARKLMPGHPDPRVNLGITLERVGKTQDALESYESALSVYEGYLPALQGRTRLEISSGRWADGTTSTLDEIALRGSDAWREWAMLWKTRQAAGAIP